MRTLRSVLILVTAMLLVSASACSPDAYRRWADADVEKLLKDREKKTIDYEPQVVAPTTMPTNPPKQAYAKVPVPPKPPEASPPLEPTMVQVPLEPLGPIEFFPPGTDAPRFEPLDVQSARAPGIERLRLGPPSAPAVRHTFELFQSLAYAVQHSRDYQTRMEDLYLAALAVTFERHLFTPRPFASSLLTYTGGQQDVNYRSALNATNTIGVRQQLPYGGEIVATGLVRFVNALSDNTEGAESASAALTASIPLLRGAGMVNLEPLIQTERSLIYEVRRFEEFRRSFAVDVSTRYLRLLSAQQSIANRRFNYATLADLTERTLALYGAGRINFLQVQRSLQQQLQVESSLIQAQQNYQNQLDDFKIALGMPVDEDIQIVPIELTVTGPDIERIDAAALALQYRLDLQTSRDQIEDAQRGVQVASNGLLPDVNLTAAGILGDRNDISLRENFNARSLNYEAGVRVDWPLDRVDERNVYRRSLILLERATRAFTLTRDNVLADVRSDVRGIQSAQVTVEIQRRGIDLAQRRLDFANELLLQGRSTDSRD
ncbi:MAG: TolC family protein, partial [Anaerolineae bacterium]|nr:TolC family protein [Phycisphaerae bacterium]